MRISARPPAASSKQKRSSREKKKRGSRNSLFLLFPVAIITRRRATARSPGPRPVWRRRPEKLVGLAREGSRVARRPVAEARIDDAEEALAPNKSNRRRRRRTRLRAPSKAALPSFSSFYSFRQPLKKQQALREQSDVVAHLWLPDYSPPAHLSLR